MQEFLAGLSQETEVLLVLSIILFAGFVMTRLTNTLNLPKVSGYILAGILIGPYGLNLIPMKIISSMGFVSDLALAFIAFGVGKFFKRDVMKKTGGKIITITVFEALTAGVLVTLFMRLVFHMDWDFALILGAIATATAPASTMMTINQYKAKGEFVNTLLQIVALDDVVCLLAFSIVAAVASGHAAGSLAISDVVMPIVFNLLALLLGFFCGYFLSRLLIPTRSKDNRLILAIAMLLGISGICAAVNISPLLSCMVFGASYINLTSDKKLYRQINNFSPPVMSVFFIVSGMNLDVRALATVGVVGVSYFIVRIVGKYLGTYISCALTGTSREIRNYMGLALIPQAGVAIGLAFLGQRLLPPETGKLMLTIILSSSVLYEMVGPISAKVALLLSGSISGKDILDKMVVTGQEEQEEQERNSGQDEELEEIETEGSGSGSDGEEDEKISFCETDTDENEAASEKDSDNDEDSGGDEAGNQGDSAEDGAGSEEDSGHELTNYIREMSQGVDEQDEFDIEQDLLSEKQEKCKKGGKGKKQGKKK
ncbi:MAG: cation:proton antiporter [Hungatella hathewayi]|nr:cation:proton antiporter [Hungatella hathewayi]